MSRAKTIGGTRWRVFFLVLGVGVLGIGLMFVSLQRGVLAASFTVAGTPYKATADNLNAQGVVQFGSLDQSANAAHPVLVNGFRQAHLDNFCQSILIPDVPVVGAMTVRITAPGGMNAQNLVLGVQDVAGDLKFNNVEIGRDAGALNKGPVQGKPGGFGIQMDSLSIARLRQVAWSTTASTLQLNQVNIAVDAGTHECF